MAEQRSFIPVAAAVVLALGIAIGGWQIGHGFVAGREPSRVVSVKGVAEREVKADLALWPLRFVATGNDLAQVQGKVTADETRVRAFLTAAGLTPDTTEVQGLEVTDLLAQAYRSGPVDSRYIVGMTLMVRTTDVEKVVVASQQLGRLVAAGVVLSGQGGGPIQGPVYLFTRLNDIKPSMIEDATKNARQAAEQFAHDSDSRIDGILRASQGLFQILPRDDVPGAGEQQQVAKIVRVVSTIDYDLAPK